MVSRPLVGLTARRLAAGRVSRWQAAGTGEQQPYLDAIHRAGAHAALLAPVDGLADDERAGVAADLLTRIDALVLTGGPDLDPATYGQVAHSTVYGLDAVVDAFELELARAAHASSIPVLAICRGLQVLNVALGGSLHQHIPEDPGVAPHGTPAVDDGARLHTFDLDASSRLASAIGTTSTRGSCHHHQAVDRLAPGLRVVARAPDGIIEACELDPSTDRFFVAVQWHPEDTASTDPVQQRLFDALVVEARSSSGAGARTRA